MIQSANEPYADGKSAYLAVSLSTREDQTLPLPVKESYVVFHMKNVMDKPVPYVVLGELVFGRYSLKVYDAQHNELPEPSGILSYMPHNGLLQPGQECAEQFNLDQYYTIKPGSTYEVEVWTTDTHKLAASLVVRTK
jgi:hypothetical protein